MTRKTSSSGLTTVEIHTHPNLPLNRDTSRADAAPRVDLNLPNLTHPRNLPRAIGTPEHPDLDAIMPVSPVTISAISTSPVQAPTPTQRPLKHYWAASSARFSDPDALGLRTFKGRQYADVPGGGVVHIHIDPETGLYRAKLPSELQPSGPVLLRDADSNVWHPLDDVESRSFPLTATRLKTFRTHLDFTDVAPGGDGLHRHDGKLYVVIENHAYQVLHDIDASSPQLSVMRIVRPEDPVAQDAGNIYVAMRPGQSEPVFFNKHNGWAGRVVDGAGGMRPGPSRVGNGQPPHVEPMNNSQQRVRELFPSFDQEQVSTFIQSLGDDVAGGLTRRETEYAALAQELKRWSQENSSDKWKASMSATIQRCWRRETGTELALSSVAGNLPALQADFSHIEVLELYAFNLSAGADTFLTGFPGLKKLTIIESELETIPAAVKEMHRLTSIDLSYNRIALDEHGTLHFRTLGLLEDINLSGNELGAPPDFSGMSGLKVLNLSATGIDRWPKGLQSQAGLEVVDLRYNRLREVPQSHLNPPAEQLEAVARINNVTLLEGNPFPADYWQHFDRYWQRLSLAHPDIPASAKPGAFYCANPNVERWLRMFPDRSLQQARQFFLDSGARAETELLRLEREFNSLQDQLNAWAVTGRGASQPYIRVSHTQPSRFALTDRHEAKRRIIQCWKQETPQEFSSDGMPIGQELDLSGLSLTDLPQLDVDFSHVGSLKLNDLNLNDLPEGFLLRFRHVRWLDLSNNRLRDLPPSIVEMHGMTDLVLRGNQITLTPATARILSERVTLRRLDLRANPLSITPDFTQLTDMRVLDLSNTGIETWPSGLGEQPLLAMLLLGNNRITTIPDLIIAPSNERLAQTTHITSVTDVSGNPLSDATREQVRQYGERVAAAGLTVDGNRNSLVFTAPHQAYGNSPATPSIQHWIKGLPQAQIAARTGQWQALIREKDAVSLFEMLERLGADGEVHVDLQRRVWDVLDSISENTPESQKLRQEVFDKAGDPACRDRAAFSFSNLEVMSLVHKASTQAKDQTQGLTLSAFARGLFRLDEVDKFASIDIARSQSIVADPKVSNVQKAPHRSRLMEEIEIRLAYRFGLKDRLQLPGQPEQVTFISMGQVSQSMLDDAYTKIVALDNSPEERQALLSREFWKVYVINKYLPQFEAKREPYHDRLTTEHERFAADQMTEAAYHAQNNDLAMQLVIEEADLIQALTQQELAKPNLAGQAAALPD